jgi:hypothetical protein
MGDSRRDKRCSERKLSDRAMASNSSFFLYGWFVWARFWTDRRSRWVKRAVVGLRLVVGIWLFPSSDLKYWRVQF